VCTAYETLNTILTVKVVRLISCALAGGDPVGSYIVPDVVVHTLDDINDYEPLPEESQHCMVLLLLQYGLMIFKSRNLEF
jgi:hypothetical protein